MGEYDLIIVAGLLALALIANALERTQRLLERSPILFLCALLGGLGLGLVPGIRERLTRARLRLVQEEVRRREQSLDELEAKYGPDDDMRALRARLRNQVIVRQKQILLLEAENALTRYEIDEMTPAEIARAAEALGLES